MAVKQFVGARYVPKFSEPIEWSSDRTYEAIEVVMHQGASYISKQPVPVGVEITNTDFWLNAYDYNAQFEQLRQTVETYDGRISDNAQAIENISDLSYVGNHGAKENDATVDWQAVINAVAAVSDTISFGAGNWLFSEPVTIPKSVMRIVGSGASITVTTVLDTLFLIPERLLTETERPFIVDGLHVNGGLLDETPLANTLFKVQSTNTAQFINCTFRNFLEFGIDTMTTTTQGTATKLGGWFANCIFYNQHAIGVGVGVRVRTDSFITMCKFFCLKTGVIIKNGFVDSCYFYSIAEGSRHTEGIRSDEGYTTFLDVGSCEFDCITRCLINVRLANVHDCHFYWNGIQDTLSTSETHAIFYADRQDSTLNAESSLINCLFDQSTEVPLAEGSKIVTFDGCNVSHYHSEKCYLTGASRNSDVFYLTIGMKTNLNATFSYAGSEKFIEMLPANSPTVNTEPVIAYEMAALGLSCIAFHAAAISLVERRPVLHPNAIEKIWQNWAQDKQSTWYIAGSPEAITSIDISSGKAYNMRCKPLTSVDTSGLVETEKSRYKLVGE